MDLSPMACSLASRIIAYEAGIDLRFIEVDPETKRTLDGEDYLEIYPLGLVPALRTVEGPLLTENAAVLQYLARCAPAAALAPRGGLHACSNGCASSARSCTRPCALEAAGARYLARGGAHRVWEGDWNPRRIVLLELPSTAAWEAFYTGPVYQGLKSIRDECSSARLVCVEGVT